MTLHFAYGSNMSVAPMRRRCPGARPLACGRLSGWRYVIVRDGYASIMPAPGGVVHGVVWRLTPRDVAALDAYESLATGLYRKTALTVALAGRRLRCMVYVAQSEALGRPLPGYHSQVVIPAAREWGLPKAYIAELLRWDTPSRKAAVP